MEIERLESELAVGEEQVRNAGGCLNSGKNLTCFKVYDVRGKLGEELMRA